MATKLIILPTPRNELKRAMIDCGDKKLNAQIRKMAVELAGSAKAGRKLFLAWLNREKHPLRRKLDNRVKALYAAKARESCKRRAGIAKSMKRWEMDMTPKKMPKRLRELADTLDRSEYFSYTPYDLAPIANELRTAASLMASLMAKTPTIEKRGYLRRSARAN